jgi:HNH endonuclease
MATSPPRKRNIGPKAFHRLDLVLAERGYPKIKAKGIYYWLWEVATDFPLYSHRGTFGSNKLFIDVKLADLAKALSAIKGVIPPDKGATKNGKFEQFSSRKMHYLSGLPEHEGWLFQFKDADSAHKFLDVCEEYASNGLASATEKALTYEQMATRSTSKQATVVARVGQDKFREKVIKYWKTCAVTGCSVTSLLKSSHVKPWAVSDALERLDAFNGILLIPNLDSLFDAGLISFTDGGAVLIAPELSEGACQSLGVTPAMRLRKVNTAHLPYLRYHREQVYRD